MNNNITDADREAANVLCRKIFASPEARLEESEIGRHFAAHRIAAVAKREKEIVAILEFVLKKIPGSPMKRDAEFVVRAILQKIQAPSECDVVNDEHFQKCVLQVVDGFISTLKKYSPDFREAVMLRVQLEMRRLLSQDKESEARDG